MQYRLKRKEEYIVSTLKSSAKFWCSFPFGKACPASGWGWEGVENIHNQFFFHDSLYSYKFFYVNHLNISNGSFVIRLLKVIIKTSVKMKVIIFSVLFIHFCCFFHPDGKGMRIAGRLINPVSRWEYSSRRRRILQARLSRLVEDLAQRGTKKLLIHKE